MTDSQDKKPKTEHLTIAAVSPNFELKINGQEMKLKKYDVVKIINQEEK